MQFKLVQCVDGAFIETKLHPDNVVPAMEIRGFEFVGFNTNTRQRKELQGQPKFAGVLGPMWDGTREDPEGCIRYECPAAYERLSS